MQTSRGIVVAIVVAACAPSVDGPVERQRVIDHADGERIAAQLARLPGAVHAEVTMRRPVDDPLRAAPSGLAPSAGVLIVIDDRADRAAVVRAATTLVHAAAPEIAAPAIVVEVGARRAELAQVGPFTVEASSRGPLRAALASVLAVIAALAGWIALRERQRRGNSAQ